MVITDELNEIKNTILTVVPAEKIYLFGSYARGDVRDGSDYDIYIVLPEGMKQGKAVEDVYGALFDRTPYKKSVDIVAGNSKTFDRRKNLPTLERVVEREGVTLYERQ